MYHAAKTYGSVKPHDVRYAYKEGKWVPADNSTPRFSRQTLAADAQISWRFGAASAHPIDLQLGAGKATLRLGATPDDNAPHPSASMLIHSPRTNLYKVFFVGKMLKP